jgi:hypothetical protein
LNGVAHVDDEQVLWLDLEQPRRVSQRRFAEVGAHPRLWIYRKAPTIDALKVTIQKHGITLLVIDSLSTFLRLENENDNAEMVRKFTPIITALHQLDVTSLWIDHAGKTDAATGRNLRGASAKLQLVDIAVELKAEGKLASGRRRLCFSSREEPTADLIIRYDGGRFSLDGAVHAVEILAHADDIINGIHLGHNRKETLARYLQTSTKSVERWIGPLIERRFVTIERGVGRGAPVCYRVTNARHSETRLEMSDDESEAT